MDRAIDIATNKVTPAADAFRERFRYRCTNRTCKAFVVPCLGEQRQYFRHEQGSAFCPEMADEGGNGTSGDERLRLMCRLVLSEQDDWSFQLTKLNVISLACELRGTDLGKHPHNIGAFSHAREPLFVQPGFGGMQLADASPIYPGEAYFMLHLPGREDPAQTLRGIARRQGNPKQGMNLYRLSLPEKWTPPLEAWATSTGLHPSLSPRFRWHADPDLNQPEDFTGASFSALFSSPETGGHHVSLFMESPVEAAWSVLTWIDSESFALPKRFIDVVCRYERHVQGELYTRVESDLALSGDWRDGGKWTSSFSETRRSFIVHVGDHFAVYGHIVLPSP